MLFPEQALREFVGGQLEVFSHIAENPCKRAHTERIRLGNGDVVLPFLRGGESHVTASLARDLVPHASEELGQLQTGEVTGAVS